MGEYSNGMELSERMGDLRSDLEDGFRETTESAMEDVRQRAYDQFVRDGHVATGDHLRPYVTVQDVTNTITADVIFPAPLGYVEYGTGQRGDAEGSPAPSPKPPLEPILEWVRAKEIVPIEYSNQVDLAFAIQETIGEWGTEAHPFVRPTWATYGYDHVVEANETMLRDAVRRF